MTGEPRYVPAAGRAAFTRLYDPVVALTMRERRFRALLQAQVLGALPDHGTVVDVGCGTGTFAIDLATAHPGGAVIAVDGDADILLTARRKPGADRVDWRQGLAGELPLEADGADAVVMSLLLHHLDAAGKRAALAEAHRVLGPGGSLHIADWGRPADPVMGAAFFVLRMLDGFDNTRDHVAGRVPGLVGAAGFGGVERRARLRTAWGSLELLAARSSA
jgi:SAM-dependent methyltransferase